MHYFLDTVKHHNKINFVITQLSIFNYLFTFGLTGVGIDSIIAYTFLGFFATIFRQINIKLKLKYKKLKTFPQIL